ncbi:hypothetical protein LZT24_04885 [Aeromonas veronii]|uniref:hypothetical protein n=1 Tax=Aeromonas veronii TaxID=654 RepID=UPI0021E8A7BD|nr:hypothetical protein [Aeromonas veronii]MCV3283420.1 hypothetical protein [Aeromonas veronii]
MQEKAPLIKLTTSRSAIYAVHFANGITKVGLSFTGSATSRIEQACKLMQFKDGSRPVAQFIHAVKGSPFQHEAKLIHFCQRSGELVHGKEWFSGVNFDELQAFAATIVHEEGRNNIHVDDQKCKAFFDGITTGINRRLADGNKAILIATLGTHIADEVSERIDGLVDSLYGVDVSAESEGLMNYACDHLGYLRDVLAAFAASHQTDGNHAQAEVVLQFVCDSAGIEPSMISLGESSHLKGVAV